MAQQQPGIFYAGYELGSKLQMIQLLLVIARKSSGLLRTQG